MDLNYYDNKIKFYERHFAKIYGPIYKYTHYRFNFESLFRGRHIKDKTLSEVKREITHTDNIWSPKKESCSKQRCSDKNESLLYLSSHISSIPIELELKKNDLVAIVRYEPSRYLESLAIVGKDELIKIPSEGNFTELIRNHNINKTKEIVKADKLFSDIFKCKRHHFSFDIYDLTIALSHLFLLKDTSIGLIYPSVASGYKSFNLALKPELVKEILNPIDIGIYLVEDNNSTDYAEFVKLSFGEIFSEGNIKWIDIENGQPIIYEK